MVHDTDDCNKVMMMIMKSDNYIDDDRDDDKDDDVDNDDDHHHHDHDHDSDDDDDDDDDEMNILMLTMLNMFISYVGNSNHRPRAKLFIFIALQKIGFACE